MGVDVVLILDVGDVSVEIVYICCGVRIQVCFEDQYIGGSQVYQLFVGVGGYEQVCEGEK